MAVDLDATGGRVVETEEQTEDGRFATPRFTDESRGSAGKTSEVETVESRLAFIVSESHILKPDVALAGRKLLGRR
jgi:hypothetical protein